MASKSKTQKAPSRRQQHENERAKDGQSIVGRAMLANVALSLWEGRKHDRDVTAEVNKERHAAADAGRYHKHLFGGSVPQLSAIIGAASALRVEHYKQTLPWSDVGWRLLPSTNYFEYTKVMRERQAVFVNAVRTFIESYPDLCALAKTKLGNIYRADDYPTVGQLQRRYQVELEFSPLPLGNDFRLQLPQEELDRMSRELEDRVTSATVDAMKDAWARLGNSVMKVRKRLDDGKGLREATLENMKETAEMLGRLNVTADAALEQCRADVLAELATFSAEELRTDPIARHIAADAADDILEKMKGFYTPTTDDEDADDE